MWAVRNWNLLSRCGFGPCVDEACADDAATFDVVNWKLEAPRSELGREEVVGSILTAFLLKSASRVQLSPQNFLHPWKSFNEPIPGYHVHFGIVVFGRNKSVQDSYVFGRLSPIRLMTRIWLDPADRRASRHFHSSAVQILLQIEAQHVYIVSSETKLLAT